MIKDLKVILYAGLFVIAFLGVSMLFMGQIDSIVRDSFVTTQVTSTTGADGVVTTFTTTITDALYSTYNNVINDVVKAFSNTPLVIKIGILAIVIGMLFKLVAIVTGGNE